MDLPAASNKTDSLECVSLADESELSLSDLFILIGEAFQEEQKLQTFRHDTPVKEAIPFMIENNYSQVPAVIGSHVLGVFSFRSFTKKGLECPEGVDIFSLPVEEFLEELTFSPIDHELLPLLDEFELKDAILIGTNKQLQGIVTSIDVIQLFKKLSLSYIMIREIELTIRNLIKLSIDVQKLIECAKRVLNHYDEENLPDSLEDMTLNDQIQIITYGDIWNLFEPNFGPNRYILSSILRPIPELRNIVFHFKRELTDTDFKTIKTTRDWMLQKYRRYIAIKEAEI